MREAAGLLRVVVAGGGTGGHAYPAVALAEALRGRGCDVLMVGTAAGPEARLAAAAGIPFEAVGVSGFERRLSPGSVVAAARLAAATARGVWLLGRLRPGAAVGTGGYASLPVALAAPVRRVPLVLHEQNAIPGLANRVAGRWAAAVGVSLPGTEGRFGRRARLVGNPVRPSIAGLDRAEVRSEAVAHLGLEAGRATLLVAGGSQGARRVNEVLLACYERWRERADLQVLHLTGTRWAEGVGADLDARRAPGDGLVWRVLGYTERMDLAYAAADLAVARAGATTLAELAAAGVPAVLIPYPFATGDHQRFNAEAAVAAGGAEMVLEARLGPEGLAGRVEALIADAASRSRMAAAMRGLSRPGAAEQLADLVLEVAR